jgi:outer membrane lipoprotein-sorting protein
VFTGSEAYFYEPENAQVTVFDSFKDSPVSNAMKFLWGQGELTKSFAASACDAKCVKADEATSIVLKPKEQLAAVEHIQLDVDPQSSRVKRSIVFDPLGNRTEYAFTSLDLAAKVPDGKFVFSIPTGVSVLRANADERH